MKRNQEWNELLGNLMTYGKEEFASTQEHAHIQKQRKVLGDFLEGNLAPDDRDVVVGILCEFRSYEERECEIAYQQGLKDAVWLLKQLNVLT